MILPVLLYATTDRSAPFKVGEPISEQNPLQVTEDINVPFSLGEVVSPTNPLPVTTDLEEDFNFGEPVSQSNRLPVIIGGVNDTGEPITKQRRAGLTEGAFDLDIGSPVLILQSGFSLLLQDGSRIELND